MPQPATVTVVIATRNRCAELLTTLGMLASLPDRPAVAVVDNGSTDGTALQVGTHHPAVRLLALRSNVGGRARTFGAARSATPYVAFSDDDSWWAPGSLGLACELLDRHPRLALVTGRVLVGDRQRLDPLSAQMRVSPLPARADLPGRPVLGFLACAAVVRREAFLAVGGFDQRLGIGGEEELVALDLADAGWALTYLDEVIAHHHPSAVARDPAGRRRVQARNALWTSWLRHPGRAAAHRTVTAVRAARRDPVDRAALVEALRGLPWVFHERRAIGGPVAADLRRLWRAGPDQAAR
jgi:GT2 family glycosyltransferase